MNNATASSYSQTEQMFQSPSPDTKNLDVSRHLHLESTVSMDTKSESLEKAKNSPLIRSKTFDHSLLSHMQSDNESKTERKKLPYSTSFPRTNSQYHKAFKDVSESEQLKQSYTCALQKDILYQGRLFVSENWICFHSKVFGKDTKIIIPVTSVTIIKKTKTAMLVPNALIIATLQEKYVFVSFLSRDTTYKVLMSVCWHLAESCVGKDLIHSSTHRPYRMTSSPLHMSFSVDSPAVDNQLIQSRQASVDSSSSDSPECKTIPERRWNVSVMKPLRPVSLNFLLMLYLVLVCILTVSTCYMAFKIMSLEQRMMSLDSFKELSHKRDDGDYIYSPSVYSALSTTIVKLEKIHRSLQRILEETQ